MQSRLLKDFELWMSMHRCRLICIWNFYCRYLCVCVEFFSFLFFVGSNENEMITKKKIEWPKHGSSIVWKRWTNIEISIFWVFSIICTESYTWQNEPHKTHTNKTHTHKLTMASNNHRTIKFYYQSFVCSLRQNVAFDIRYVFESQMKRFQHCKTFKFNLILLFELRS